MVGTLTPSGKAEQTQLESPPHIQLPSLGESHLQFLKIYEKILRSLTVISGFPLCNLQQPYQGKTQRAFVSRGSGQ